MELNDFLEDIQKPAYEKDPIGYNAMIKLINSLGHKLAEFRGNIYYCEHCDQSGCWIPNTSSYVGDMFLSKCYVDADVKLEF